MPNQEDYLDNLLGSIEDVRTHSSNEAKKTEDKSKKNNMDRRAISPKDDFLEASGLSKYEPVKIERQNLKMALSQDDFIKKFEDDIENDEDSDKFLQEFEEELYEDESNGKKIDEDAILNDIGESHVNKEGIEKDLEKDSKKEVKEHAEEKDASEDDLLDFENDSDKKISKDNSNNLEHEEKKDDSKNENRDDEAL